MIEAVEGGEFLFEAFWEIDRFRANGINGPDPIRPRDIVEWCEMTGTILRREEKTVLLKMDAAYRKAVREEDEANAARREKSKG